MKKKTGIACIIALMALTISAAAEFVPTLENGTTAKVRILGKPIPMVNSSKSSADLDIFARVFGPRPINRYAEPELLAKLTVTKAKTSTTLTK